MRKQLDFLCKLILFPLSKEWTILVNSLQDIEMSRANIWVHSKIKYQLDNNE